MQRANSMDRVLILTNSEERQEEIVALERHHCALGRTALRCHTEAGAGGSKSHKYFALNEVLSKPLGSIWLDLGGAVWSGISRTPSAPLAAYQA